MSLASETKVFASCGAQTAKAARSGALVVTLVAVAVAAVVSPVLATLAADFTLRLSFGA